MTLEGERFPVGGGESATITAGLITDLKILDEVLIWRQKHAQDEEPPDHPFFEVVNNKIVLHKEPGKVIEGWSPSTRFDDAMEVAWELEQRGFIIGINSADSQRRGICVVFDLPDRKMPGQSAQTLPLAICRAALMTMKNDDYPCNGNAEREILNANIDWKDLTYSKKYIN
jgi:hypothetical protein